MSSSTDYRPVLHSLGEGGSPITNHRPFLHSAPAVILAVSLLLGCLAGRFTHEGEAPWLSVTLPAISILAMVQPSPLALVAVGIAAGVALETLRTSHFGEVPEFEGWDLTLKGKVVEERPSLYGLSVLKVKASEVWGLECVPVNFHIRASVPSVDEIVKGSEVVMRVALREVGSRFNPLEVKGRIVTGGWRYGPKPHSHVVKGRERLLSALDGFRDTASSGLLSAISLGERWRVDAGTRDILRRTGTYHLLAISGVHVGAAILPFLFLLRLCVSASQRTRPSAARAVLLMLSVCAVGVYMCFTGLSASALRATVYFVLVGSAALVGRSSSSLSSLSWCVLLIVCFSAGQHPDISLALSALAVTGIILSGRELSSGGVGNLLKGMVRMTMGAVLFTLPVVVWLAGGISVIALVGNIVAGLPFGLFLIPSAVLMDWAALFPWFPLEPIVSIWLKAAGLVLGLMAHLADLPVSFMCLSPAGCLVASLSAIAGILIWRRKRYRLGVGIGIFLFILAVSTVGQFIGESINRDVLAIRFPRVGQADAAIIRYNGQTVLVDCGPPGFPGRDNPVARALQRMGVRNIDALFLSHSHPDHAGGLVDIMARWPVQVIYLSENYSEGREWGSIHDRTHAATQVWHLRYGDVVKLSSMVFTVLGPEGVEMPVRDVNRGSLQLLLEVDGFSALFTGDAGWDQVRRSLAGIHSLDLLKIPHHGSKMGFPPVGMDDVFTPISRHGDIVAVCPSRSPGKRHLPAPEVGGWFERRGVKFVYTGDNGVKIRYKKGRSPKISIDNILRFWG